MMSRDTAYGHTIHVWLMTLISNKSNSVRDTKFEMTVISVTSQLVTRTLYSLQPRRNGPRN